MARSRYVVSSSAGSRPDKPFAVVDTQDKQGGKGMRRVSFHRTFISARSEAARLNKLQGPYA